MATRNSKTAAKAASKTTGRRSGRPTNIERAAKVQSQAMHFINLAAASYAAGMTAALGIEGGVQTLGNLPSSIAQSAQSASAGSATASTSQSSASTSGRSRTKQAPGRRVDEGSAMSQTRRFYDENLKAANPLARAEFVREAAKRFGYTPQTANTYVSNIERDGGYKLVRRGGTGAARGRSRSNGSASAKKSASA
jgi:hypothetical protein